MTILYVVAHSIEPEQLNAHSDKFKRSMKMLFSNGKIYVYLDDPIPWDNRYFNFHRMREQSKLFHHLLGDLCDDEKISVQKFVGKEVKKPFVTHEDDDD